MKEQEIRKTLAEKLHTFRLNAGLTAKEVGVRIGKSEKTVSGWEHGRGQPDADMLFVLCDLYGISSIADFYAEKQAVPAETLAGDEAELLAIYRAMNKAGKEMLMATARGFAGNPSMQEDVAKEEMA